MIEVIFTYNETNTIIQCNLKDKINDIYQQFKNHIDLKNNNIYYSYSGKTYNELNKGLILEEMINDEDKKRNKMNILILNKELIDVKGKKEIIKSKDLISPQNNENMEIYDYKINLNKYTFIYIR